MLGLCCALVTPDLLAAGTFRLHNGDLLPTDEIDIIWRQKIGDCPTKFSAQSINCTYTYENSIGFEVSHVNMLSYPVQQTFEFHIKLSAETKKKKYSFDAKTCLNLQSRIKAGSVVTINKTGCTVR